MTKELIKVGNSTALLIPAEEVKKLNLRPGDQVEVFSDGHQLSIVPLKKKAMRKLGGLLKGIKISKKDIKDIRDEAWGSLHAS